MRFAHFFVDRPIFASVTSIIFLLLGFVAYETLPVSQYPEIVPPTVTVRASFPGANAETVAATIATFALCGFANFSSIAINIGCIGGIAPSRRGELAKLGLRAMLGGALASCLTATIAGLLS